MVGCVLANPCVVILTDFGTVAFASVTESVPVFSVIPLRLNDNPDGLISIYRVASVISLATSRWIVTLSCQSNDVFTAKTSGDLCL